MLPNHGVTHDITSFLKYAEVTTTKYAITTTATVTNYCASLYILRFTNQALSAPACALLSPAGVAATKLQCSAVKVSHLNQLAVLVTLCMAKHRQQERRQCSMIE
jgi:hypothetical protein